MQDEVNTTEERPRKYYFTESIDSTETDNEESSSASTNLKEHDLYPILYEFLRSENVFSKRIDEKRSSNRGGRGSNEWLHPDLVGLEDLGRDWGNGIKVYVGKTRGKLIKLWSFEVKPEITIGNVRKSFFQAVSNSSWANLGYLVTGSIEREKGKRSLMKEINMLANRHGIGLIRLDVENPLESEIIIPATERSEIDWDMVNRVASVNPDFSEFIGHIFLFHSLGKIPQDLLSFSDGINSHN